MDFVDSAAHDTRNFNDCLSGSEQRMVENLGPRRRAGISGRVLRRASSSWTLSSLRTLESLRTGPASALCLWDFWGGIVKLIVETFTAFGTEAIAALIVQPLNTAVPPQYGVGVITLDIRCANRFVHEIARADLVSNNFSVVGCRVGPTIIPHVSQDAAAMTTARGQDS